MAKQYDIFISHSSEDKDSFVRPLAEALRRLGLSVWYDDFTLQIGQSVSQEIAKGIAGARIGIVVISRSFIRRRWTKHELQGLLNRSVEEDMRLLPIWHGVTKDEVSGFDPSLADKLAIDTQRLDAQEAAIKILRIVRPDIYRQHPRAELERMASGEALVELQQEIEELREELSEFQCPYCRSPLSSRIPAPIDPEERDWDERETYACGFTRFAGATERPCPKDPKFPKLDEYDLICERASEDEGGKWMCYARPKTDMARTLSLDMKYGSTKSQALRKVRAEYEYQAGRISNQEWFAIQMGSPSKRQKRT